jgi:hypothetical protein
MSEPEIDDLGDAFWFLIAVAAAGFLAAGWALWTA